MVLSLVFRWFSPPVDIFVRLGDRTTHHNLPAVSYPHVMEIFFDFFIFKNQ